MLLSFDDFKNNKVMNESKYSLLTSYQNHIALFDGISEDAMQLKSVEVVSKLNKDAWEEPNAASFHKAINKSKHSSMLTQYSVDEFKKMKLFKLKGFNIGFALKKFNDTNKFSEIVAVFNNEPDVKGIGEELMQAAIRNGGCYLDHFDGFLSKLYSKMGFIEYKRDAFDPQYDEDGSFRAKYGEADVIYRYHKTCTLSKE